MVCTLVNIVEIFCCSSSCCSRLDCRCCGRGAPELSPSDGRIRRRMKADELMVDSSEELCRSACQCRIRATGILTGLQVDGAWAKLVNASIAWECDRKTKKSSMAGGRRQRGKGRWRCSLPAAGQGIEKPRVVRVGIGTSSRRRGSGNESARQLRWHAAASRFGKTGLLFLSSS
jgi:hypothetical protein